MAAVAMSDDGVWHAREPSRQMLVRQPLRLLLAALALVAASCSRPESVSDTTTSGSSWGVGEFGVSYIDGFTEVHLLPDPFDQEIAGTCNGVATRASQTYLFEVRIPGIHPSISCEISLDELEVRPTFTIVSEVSVPDGCVAVGETLLKCPTFGNDWLEFEGDGMYLSDWIVIERSALGPLGLPP